MKWKSTAKMKIENEEGLNVETSQSPLTLPHQLTVKTQKLTHRSINLQEPISQVKVGLELGSQIKFVFQVVNL